MKGGGANACERHSFALGRELRRVRAQRRVTPKALSAAAGMPRNKLDALELGELGDPGSKKRAGHLTRAEAVDLFLFPALELSIETADALLFLAHEAGAMTPGEVYDPITPVELRSHGREPPAAATRRARIDAAVRALLVAHPFTARRGMAPLRPAGAWEIPASRCSLFVGRSVELASLRRVLLSTGTGVVCVSGAAGSGKSELVRAAIDDDAIRAHFHASVWITAREREFLGHASSSPSAAIDAVAEVAAHLAVPGDRLAQVLSGAPILIVLDNAEALDDEDAVISRLGQMIKRSKVVVTSRNRSVASFVLPFPPSGPLAGLSVAESTTLLAHELAARGGAAVDPRTLGRVAEASGGSPLVLHWIAGQAPAEPLRELARALEAGGAPELGDFMFGRAWQRLAPDARRLLRIMAYETVDAIPHRLLAEIAGSKAADRTIPALSRAAVVEAADASAPLSLHPLARSFVRSRARPVSGGDGRTAAALRYLIRSLADDARGSDAAKPLGGLRNHLRWMELAIHLDPALVMTAWTKLSRYLWEHWHWHLYEECSRVGAAAAAEIARAARAAGTLLGALTQLDLTYLRFEQGRLDEALAIGERARTVFEELGDDAGLCLVHRYIGVVLMENGNARSMAAARTSFRRALEAIARARRGGVPRRSAKIQNAAAQLRRIGLWDVIQGGYGPYRGAWAPSEAEIHTLLGDHAVRQGDIAGAVPVLEKAVDLYERADGRWPGSEGAPILALGGCYEKLGRMPDAERMYARAMEIAASTGRLDLRGAVLVRLARLRAASSPRDALEQARAAKAIFDELGQTKAAADASELISRSAVAPRSSRA